LLRLTTDGHKASRGLSATAELIVRPTVTNGAIYSYIEHEQETVNHLSNGAIFSDL